MVLVSKSPLFSSQPNGLIRWLEANPNHAEREDVVRHLHKIQEEYLSFGREYMGWAMYVLAPNH